MVDERTREYLIHLRKTLDKAEEICTCANCTKEREKKQITQCDKDRILQYLPMKMIRDPPGFTTELSSNPMYWKLGRKA